MKNALIVEYRGIRKNSPKAVHAAQAASLRIWPSGMDAGKYMEVDIDVQFRNGEQRENELLFIRFADGEQWSGTFADLQKALKVAKGIKDFEESTPIKDEGLLTDERRKDMLVGALEGGSNYWYYIALKDCRLIDEVAPDKKVPFVDRLWTAIQQGVDIAIRDVEDPREVLGSINMQRIMEGEALMKIRHAEHWADIINESDDATTADVWFQMVVLKELVYG